MFVGGMDAQAFDKQRARRRKKRQEEAAVAAQQAESQNAAPEDHESEDAGEAPGSGEDS
jgi:hypothetical protein